LARSLEIFGCIVNGRALPMADLDYQGQETRCRVLQRPTRGSVKNRSNGVLERCGRPRFPVAVNCGVV
jgi:hypothetical protein